MALAVPGGGNQSHQPSVPEKKKWETDEHGERKMDRQNTSPLSSPATNQLDSQRSANAGQHSTSSAASRKQVRRESSAMREYWLETLCAKTLLTRDEFNSAVDLFRKQDISGDGSLDIAETDILFRRMSNYMSVRRLWAIILEVDEDSNGTVELDEFVTMVSKLRGRLPLSKQFYLRQLPRSLRDRFCKVFAFLDTDKDGLLTREQLITGSKQLSDALKLKANVDPNSAEFQKHLSETFTESESDGQVGLESFLIFQAKIQKVPPDIDVALLSLTPEECNAYSEVFYAHDDDNSGTMDASEIQKVFAKLGKPLSNEEVRDMIKEISMDDAGEISLKEFLYLFVNLGAGTAEPLRVFLTPGATYEEAFSIGYDLEQLFELGYDDVGAMRKAGWGANCVWKAGIADALALRQVGYSASDLRKCGCSAQQLKLVGYSLEELRNAGYSSQVLRECCKNLAIQRATPQDSEPGVSLVPMSANEIAATAEDKMSATCPALRWWDTPRIKALLNESTSLCNGDSPSVAEAKRMAATAPP